MELTLEDETVVEVETLEELRTATADLRLILFVVANQTKIAEDFAEHVLKMNWPRVRAVRTTDDVYGRTAAGACFVLLDRSLPRTKMAPLAQLRAAGVPELDFRTLAHGLVTPAVPEGAMLEDAA